MHFTDDDRLETACLCAALVLDRESDARRAIERLRDNGAAREPVREAVLQTYLFDGYPTALEGLALLGEIWPGDAAPGEHGAFGDWPAWESRGMALYERIYGEVGRRLQERAHALSPELALWMIVEGYGKVLARPGLDITARELAIVAVLAVKRRPRQLHSHLRGALRVGVPREPLHALLVELRARFDPPAIEEALALLDRLSGGAGAGP